MVITTSSTNPNIHVGFITLSIVSLLYQLYEIYKNQIKTPNFYCYIIFLYSYAIIYMDSLTYASHQENMTVWNFKIAFSLINATIYIYIYLNDVQLKLQPLDREILSTVLYLLGCALQRTLL